MKILSIFNHYLERGGEEIAVEAICNSLAGIEELERCDFSSTDWTGANAPTRWQQARWMFRNPQSLKKISERQWHFEPDLWLVHNVFPVGSAAIYREAISRGVPIIQYLHNFRPFSVNGYLWADNRVATGGLSGNYWQEIRHGAWQDSRLKTAWFALILSLMRTLGWWKSVKAWIAISDFVRDKFIAAGIPAENVFTLRHFWKPQPQVPKPSDGTHYLYLGRLTEAKGILVLLDAWEILERERGNATPRLVIGGDGPLRSSVISRVERMRSVHFAGQLVGEEKNRALEGCRAMIVPSLWWEPLGLVVYEAYDYCRPVLAASSGGLPEVVLDRETGLLHEPGHPEQLAHHVMQLEADAANRRAMGREGRAWLERNADENQWRERFSKIAAHALDAVGR